MVPTTSKELVSMIDTESDLVLVMNNVPASAGTATPTARAAAVIRASTDVTTILPRASRRALLDSHDGQVRGRPPQGESYRVSDGGPLVNLRGGGAEAHGHGRHVAGDVVVGDHDEVHVRQHRPHDTLALVLALARRGGGPCHRELPGEIRRLAGPPEIPGADAEDEG